MDYGSTVFADGIDTDTLAFEWGCRVDIRLAERRLHLVDEIGGQ